MFRRKARWYYVSAAWDLLLRKHGITQTRLSIENESAAQIECLGVPVILLSWQGNTLVISVSLDCNAAMVAWFLPMVMKHHKVLISHTPFVATPSILWGAEASEYYRQRELLITGDHGEVVALARTKGLC